MKKGLLIVAAVLMLAGSLQAGDIKLHQWPCQFVAQQLMTIPVIMDIGYWIRVKDQSKKIKLVQSTGSYYNYDGCITIKVDCNFNVTLSATIAEFGTDVGNFTCDITPTQLLPGVGQNVVVCAHLTGADLSIATGGTTGVQVAVVTIKVVPTV